jgi:hypothetical protein
MITPKLKHLLVILSLIALCRAEYGALSLVCTLYVGG